jgi:hypothetical protein
VNGSAREGTLEISRRAGSPIRYIRSTLVFLRPSFDTRLSHDENKRSVAEGYLTSHLKRLMRRSIRLVGAPSGGSLGPIKTVEGTRYQGRRVSAQVPEEMNGGGNYTVDR